MKTVERDTYWDIVKCIGIISVVLGHICPFKPVISFVYLYHLSVFFFVSGFFYDKEKWCNAPGQFIGSRIMTTWIRYMFYTIILVLMHNFFVNTGVYSGAALYNNTDRVSAIINSSVFAFSENLAGAMWFVPVWLGTMVILALTVSIFKLDLLIAAAIILISGLGVVMHLKGVSLQWHLQTSLIAIGFAGMGFFLRRSRIDIRKYATWWLGILAGVVLFCFNSVFNIHIDLSSNSIADGLVFVTGAVGILFSLCLAGLLNKIKVGRNILAFIGKNSFDIMAMHFAVIKLIDIVYVRLFNGDAELIGGFPSSFATELWLAYLVASLIIPSLIGCLLDKLLSLLMK